MARVLEDRPYQKRIVEKAFDCIASGDSKSILIESPTGSGKTIMALKILYKLKQHDPSMRFVWVAMRRKLLAQAREENESIGVRDISFVSMFDKNPPKADLVLTDEAQHDAASSCANIHELAGSTYSIGLTATPFRTDRVKLGYNKIIKDCGVRFLIDQGYLSQFDQYVLPEWTPRSTADALLMDPEKWGSSVIYFQNEALCREYISILEKGGVSCAFMHGKLSESERDDLFEAHETWSREYRMGRPHCSDSVQVLANIHLLTEGFDAPYLQTSWVRDSCKLPTTQMAGRVLRKDPENPDKVAMMVQSSQTRFTYTKVANPRCQFLLQDGEWRCIGEGADVLRLNRLVAENLFDKPVELPLYLQGFKKGALKLNKDGELSKQSTELKQRKSALSELADMFDEE